MATEAHVVGDASPALVEMSIGMHLRSIAEMVPSNEVVVDLERRLRFTYADFVSEVDQVAAGLVARGVQSGDRIGVWSANRAESVVVQYAAASIGAILVGLNPAYTVAELAYVAGQADIAMIFASAEYRGVECEAALRSLAATGWQGAIVIFERGWKQLLGNGQRVSQEELALRVAGVAPGMPFCLQYTSGTTGHPKGATITHRAALNNALFIGRTMRMSSEDRLCACLPFFHAFGIIACNLATISHAATVVIASPTFDAARVLNAVEAERCTVLHGVPTMFMAELNVSDFERYDLTSLRTGLMGGAQCPRELVVAAIERMHLVDLTVGFGMSELGSVTTQTVIGDPIERQVGTVGRIHPHLEARIIADGGRTCAFGEPGELVVRGYARMTGYWQEPDRTAEAIDSEGWLHSGDIATIDSEGYVQIVGRIKDMILRGGENVYPREIEDVLHAHPDVMEAYVVGVPDPAYGERVVALVRRQQGTDVTEMQLQQHCRERLAYFKVPATIQFRTSFPMTASGKVRKVELRSELLNQMSHPT